MWELHSTISGSFQKSFSYIKGFIRYGGSEYSLDVGQWWLREGEAEGLLSQTKHSEKIINYSDSVEITLVNYLLQHTPISLNHLDQYICTQFPGLLTPDFPLVNACVSSYARKISDETDEWILREEDRPLNRREDIKEIIGLLEQLGEKLGFSVQRGFGLDPTQELPVLWSVHNTKLEFVFFVQASALLHRSIINKIYSPKVSLLVIPGGRSGLVEYKIKNNPLLNQSVEAGWRFIKFRQIRTIAEKSGLTLDDFALPHPTGSNYQVGMIIL